MFDILLKYSAPSHVNKSYIHILHISGFCREICRYDKYKIPILQIVNAAKVLFSSLPYTGILLEFVSPGTCAVRYGWMPPQGINMNKEGKPPTCIPATNDTFSDADHRQDLARASCLYTVGGRN